MPTIYATNFHRKVKIKNKNKIKTLQKIAFTVPCKRKSTEDDVGKEMENKIYM